MNQKLAFHESKRVTWDVVDMANTPMVPKRIVVLAMCHLCFHKHIHASVDPTLNLTSERALATGI